MRHLLLVTLATTLIAALIAGPAAATDATVSIYNPGGDTPAGFSPDDVTVAQGETVTWQWVEGEHRLRDGGLGFIWSTKRTSPSEATHQETFAAAATYVYVCDLPDHEAMDGRVRVPMRLMRRTETGMVLRWSTDLAPNGYEYIVQARETGTVKWLMWQDGVTRANALYEPEAPGSYQFRARVRRIGVGVTGWSRSITISHESVS